MQATALFLGLILAGCGAVHDPDVPGGTGPGSSGPGGNPGPGESGESDPIVGEWRSLFSDGTAQELDITSQHTGTAVLYWYQSQWATWEVSATDDFTVTLRCPSDPDCSDAEPIVMDCAPDGNRMSCVGVSGGYGNNYAGAAFDWMK